MGEDSKIAAPAPTVDAFLEGLADAVTRRVAPGEWGLSIDAGGWPLHVGMRLDGGLLRVQGEALAPDRIGDHELLYRNRGMTLVRYAHTGAGAVWVHGELPLELLSERWLDRLLGLVVEACVVVRDRSRAG